MTPRPALTLQAARAYGMNSTAANVVAAHLAVLRAVAAAAQNPHTRGRASFDLAAAKRDPGAVVDAALRARRTA